MDAATRDDVILRAKNRCEYCLLPQVATPFFTFHVEHIYAQQHLVDDSLDNPALACPDCNRHKGPNLTTIDLGSRTILRLFHPRLDEWSDHFRYRGAYLEYQTEIGQATIRLLRINSDDRLKVRGALIELGEF